MRLYQELAVQSTSPHPSITAASMSPLSLPAELWHKILILLPNKHLIRIRRLNHTFQSEAQQISRSRFHPQLLHVRHVTGSCYRGLESTWTKGSNSVEVRMFPFICIALEQFTTLFLEGSWPDAADVGFGNQFVTDVDYDTARYWLTDNGPDDLEWNWYFAASRLFNAYDEQVATHDLMDMYSMFNELTYTVVDYSRDLTLLSRARLSATIACLDEDEYCTLLDDEGKEVMSFSKPSRSSGLIDNVTYMEALGCIEGSSIKGRAIWIAGLEETNVVAECAALELKMPWWMAVRLC